MHAWRVTFSNGAVRIYESEREAVAAARTGEEEHGGSSCIELTTVLKGWRL